MKLPDKHDVVVQAIEEVKAGEHQTTALKIELEAELELRGSLDYEDMLQMWLEKVEPLGLSEKITQPALTIGQTIDHVYYKAKAPLIFAMFYNDHSVDCELTLTLSLADPTTALLAPQIVEAFKETCAEFSDYFSVDKAGMHMAFLNSPDCVYPVDRVRPYDTIRFKNFRKSMIRLLPSLFFLGTPNANTRGLQYRKPQIEVANHHSGYDASSPKYSAVAFARGAVEFRVFDTCYDKPEMILDNIVVMCKAMQFWTRAYTRNYLPRISKPVQFGRDTYGSLGALYYTKEHLQLLEAGLKILKPDYKTIKELKAERNFTATRKQLNDKIKTARLDALKSFETYRKQFEWELVFEEQNQIRNEIRNITQGVVRVPDITEKDKVMAVAKKKAEKFCRQYKKEMFKPRTKYVSKRLQEIFPNNGGNWLLEEQDPATPPRPVTVELTPNGVSFNSTSSSSGALNETMLNEIINVAWTPLEGEA